MEFHLPEASEYCLTYLVCHLIVADVSIELATDRHPGQALDLKRHVETEIIAVVIVALEWFIILIRDSNGSDGGG